MAACSVALVVLGYPIEHAPIHIVSTAAAFFVAGSIAWLRRPANPVGPVMLVISIAGSLSFFGMHPEPFVWRAAGLAGSLANALIVWVMLAAPSGQLTGRASRAAMVAFTALVLVVAFLPYSDLLRAIFAAGAALSLAIAGLVARRWLVASPASRRVLAPIVVAGVAASLVHAADLTAGVLRIPASPGSPMYWADAITRTLVPFGFLVGLLRVRMARAAVADLVVELGDMPAPERLHEALVGALGDPTLEVVFWSEPFRLYLDRNGVPVELPTADPGRAVTLLERDGRPLAAILHDPALAEDPGLVAAVGSAVRMAVENERLTDAVRSQLAEVQASRTRIVEAADAERRRVERNLHDGAQQRLVALSLALRRAQAQLPDDASPEVTSTLEAASEQLKTALAELRELARGIHPAILTEAGLGPALRSLVRDSSVPVTLRLNLPDGLSAPVEAAAYFVAAEALSNVAKYAAASHVELAAEVDGGQLRIEVADDGRGGADPVGGSGLRGLADRVAALGGGLDVRSPAGQGTRVVARLPISAGAEMQA
jgi:signal transduction histidine kinase